MRGPSKTPPKYRKHKATGQAIVSIDGRDFYLGPYGSKVSKLEYDRLIGEWLANGRKLRPTERCISVAELIADYWRYAKRKYQKNGKTTGELPGLKIALRELKTMYGDILVNEFGPLSLVAVQNRFVERGHCRRYVNQNVGRIKRMFRWGVRNEIVPVETKQRLECVEWLRKGESDAKESEPVLPVDQSIVDQTIDALANPVVADMVKIQRLTGCRPGELMSMCPCHIDRNTGDEVWLYRPPTHKMEHKGRERIVPIGPLAQRILAKYLFRAENQHCFKRKCGKEFKRWHYAQAIKRACKKAGVEHWAPNQLRHSAATEVRQRFGLEAAQAIAGHANADVTQIYAERDLNLAINVARQLG